MRIGEREMNTHVETYKAHLIHKYGCCGTFFFHVARSDTKAIIKRTLPSLQAAKEFIDNLKIV